MKPPPPHAASKLNPALTAKLAARPDQPHSVTVTFSRSHTADEITALGLSGDGTTAYGDLDNAAILALAARSDVLSIAYRPGHTPR